MDTPLAALTIPEVQFPEELIAFGPLGMKVWCPLGVEISTSEEIAQANIPGWNLMMSKPPLDVAVSTDEGIIPTKQNPTPDTTVPTDLPPPPPPPAGADPSSGTYTGNVDTNGQFVWTWSTRPPAPDHIPIEQARGEMGSISKGAYVYFPPTTNLKEGVLTTTAGQYVWMNRVAQQVPRVEKVYGREGSSITLPDGRVISWGPGESGEKEYIAGYDTQYYYTKATTDSQGITIKQDTGLYTLEDLRKAGLHVEQRDTYQWTLSGFPPNSRVQLNRSVYGDVGEQISDANGNVTFTARASDILNKSEITPLTDPYWSQLSSHYGATTRPGAAKGLSYEEAMRRIAEEKSKGIGIPSTNLLGLFNGIYQLAELAEKAKQERMSIDQALQKRTPTEEELAKQRDALSWPDRVVFDLRQHLEDVGYTPESDNVLDNIQMAFSSLLWGVDGGFLEKDAPELAATWKVLVFVASWEAGILGKAGGEASQIAGRGIQTVAETGILRNATAAARFGRQLEIFGELKSADVGRKSIFNVVPRLGKGVLQEIKSWPRQLGNAFQRFMRNPEATPLLARDPQVQVSVWSRLKTIASPSTWKAWASAIRTGAPSVARRAMKDMVNTMRQNMSKLWRQAGAVMRRENRAAFRSYYNLTSSAEAPATRPLSATEMRLVNRSDLRSFYGTSTDAAALQRRGVSAKDAIEKQLADEMNQLRYKRRRFTSVFGEQQIGEMRSSLLWDY